MAAPIINDNSGVDSARKITLLVLGSILLLGYIYSIFRLFKVNDRKLFHIETLAVFSGFVKILLIMIEDFLINDEVFEFVTVTIQTGILGFIFYKLIKTVLEATASLRQSITKIILGLRIFYLIIAAGLLVNLVLGVISDDYFHGANVTYNYNWYVTFGINTALGYINMVTGIIVYRVRKNLRESDEYNVSKDEEAYFKRQLFILIFGYAIVSTLTLIWFITFPYIVTEGDIAGVDHPSFWIPTDNLSGVIAFIKTVLLVSPTLIIWLGFFYYRVPMSIYQQSVVLKKGDITYSSGPNISMDNVPLMSANDVSGMTQNSNNMSALTAHMRKSAFTTNNNVTKSFVKNRSEPDSDI